MILGKVLMVKNILLTGSWYGEISSLCRRIERKISASTR